MTQHTKGEWKNDPNILPGCNRVITCDGIVIAYIPYELKDGWTRIGRSEDHARLIAAAPKTKRQRDMLLEALEELHEISGYGDEYAETPIAQKVRAAIALAKGEPS